MVSDSKASANLRCTIAPFLSVRNGARAVEFFKSAFGATEVFRLEAQRRVSRTRQLQP